MVCACIVSIRRILYGYISSDYDIMTSHCYIACSRAVFPLFSAVVWSAVSRVYRSCPFPRRDAVVLTCMVPVTWLHHNQFIVINYSSLMRRLIIAAARPRDAISSRHSRGGLVLADASEFRASVLSTDHVLVVLVVVVYRHRHASRSASSPADPRLDSQYHFWLSTSCFFFFSRSCQPWRKMREQWQWWFIYSWTD